MNNIWDIIGAIIIIGSLIAIAWALGITDPIIIELPP